jgi:hypothetical protein
MIYTICVVNLVGCHLFVTYFNIISLYLISLSKAAVPTRPSELVCLNIFQFFDIYSHNFLEAPF